jgi:hypothetical protein
VTVNDLVWSGVACACALALTACDKLYGLTEVTLSDAASVVVVDGPPDGPPDASGEWGFAMIAPITTLSSNSGDGDPTLTSDMTEIYFKSTRSGGAGLDDLWYSKRATAADPWSAPMLSSLSTIAYENQPRLSPDGLTMWFRRGGGLTAKLMVTTRSVAKNDAGWSTPVQLTEFDATDTAQDAGLLSTSSPPTTGYMMSKRTGTVRIYRTTRANSTAAWSSPPTLISGLVGDGSFDQAPWVTPDQLTMIFASNRTGCKGGGDLWIARRASTADEFAAPICLTEVNSFGFEGDPWISPDLRHIYFTGPGGGGYDLFEAHR